MSVAAPMFATITSNAPDSAATGVVDAATVAAVSLRAALARVDVMARSSTSTAVTDAAPRRAALTDSTPLPQPTSSTDSPPRIRRGELHEQQPGRRVTAGPEGRARVDLDEETGRAPVHLGPREAHPEPVLDHDRPGVGVPRGQVTTAEGTDDRRPAARGAGRRRPGRRRRRRRSARRPGHGRSSPAAPRCRSPRGSEARRPPPGNCPSTPPRPRTRHRPPAEGSPRGTNGLPVGAERPTSLS